MKHQLGSHTRSNITERNNNEKEEETTELHITKINKTHSQRVKQVSEKIGERRDSFLPVYSNRISMEFN